MVEVEEAQPPPSSGTSPSSTSLPSSVLRWGYDQRGRLKADTSYTGATARATTYAYDTYERGTTLIDALGTWTTRYETTRGLADTLLTPMGDTVTYVFDGRGRANGPYLRGGGPLHSRVPVWTALAGALSTLTDTVATPTGFTPLKYDRNWVVDDPQPAGSPVWTEQRGGFHVDSLKDSLLYDGWNRVIAMVSFRNAAVLVRDTFAFDRAGNLKTTAGAEVYDATTDRLTGRAGSGCTWNNSYDRAGNLTQAVCGSTTWSFGYNALNQLRTVKQNGTLIARYGYDVLGRRIAKRVYSAATGGTVAYTRFVSHGAHVAFETDSAGTIGLRYTWGLATDDLLAIRDAAGNHYYVVQDLLSSVRGLVKRDGTWVRSLQYGAYGALLRDTASVSAPTWELRYRWTGREFDAETGWYFFRSRSYDPTARRFVQEDAIGYAGSSNVYAYGDGAPLDGRDPSGLRMDQIALYMKYGGPGGGGEFVRPGGGYGGGGRRSHGFWDELDAITATHDAIWQAQEALLAAANAIAAAAEEVAASLGNIGTGEISVGEVESLSAYPVPCPPSIEWPKGETVVDGERIARFAGPFTFSNRTPIPGTNVANYNMVGERVSVGGRFLLIDATATFFCTGYSVRGFSYIRIALTSINGTIIRTPKP